MIQFTYIPLALTGGRGEGGRGFAQPMVQPLSLLSTIFDRRGIHFAYLLLTNGTKLFHVLSLGMSLLAFVLETPSAN